MRLQGLGLQGIQSKEQVRRRGAYSRLGSTSRSVTTREIQELSLRAAAELGCRGSI